MNDNVTTGVESGWLTRRAMDIAEHLRGSGFDPASAAQRQVLCVAEEVGEFVGAYRRWSGQARRTGTAEEMHAELADVVLAAYVAAVELGFDLDAAIEAKLEKIYSRGWREGSPQVEAEAPDPDVVTAHKLDRVASVVVGHLLPYDASTGERVRDLNGVVWPVVSDSVRPAVPSMEA